MYELKLLWKENATISTKYLIDKFNSRLNLAKTIKFWNTVLR
jgi:hypothetical protein